MKKIRILLVCSFVSFFSHAQIALAKDDGTPIANGQIFTYNTTDEDAATFHYKIKNTSSGNIKVRIKVMSIQNANGNSFQFCYLSTCLPSVTVNGIYPSNSSSAISIGPNSETPSTGYNMWNSNPGTGTFPMDYVLKYYLVDGFNSEYGTPVTITYRYNPNSVLSVNDIKDSKKSYAEVLETVVKNNIQVTSKENISYTVLNMEGRSLLSGNLKKGNDAVNVSTLTSGIYMITLKNNQGQIISKKIIKND